MSNQEDEQKEATDAESAAEYEARIEAMYSDGKVTKHDEDLARKAFLAGAPATPEKVGSPDASEKAASGEKKYRETAEINGMEIAVTWAGDMNRYELFLRKNETDQDDNMAIGENEADAKKVFAKAVELAQKGTNGKELSADLEYFCFALSRVAEKGMKVDESKVEKPLVLDEETWERLNFAVNADEAFATSEERAELARELFGIERDTLSRLQIKNLFFDEFTRRGDVESRNRLIKFFYRTETIENETAEVTTDEFMKDWEVGADRVLAVTAGLEKMMAKKFGFPLTSVDLIDGDCSFSKKIGDAKVYVIVDFDRNRKRLAGIDLALSGKLSDFQFSTWSHLSVDVRAVIGAKTIASRETATRPDDVEASLAMDMQEVLDKVGNGLNEKNS